jgi:hypothetical protein
MENYARTLQTLVPIVSFFAKVLGGYSMKKAWLGTLLVMGLIGCAEPTKTQRPVASTSVSSSTASAPFLFSGKDVVYLKDTGMKNNFSGRDIGVTLAELKPSGDFSANSTTLKVRRNLLTTSYALQSGKSLRYRVYQPVKTVINTSAALVATGDTVLRGYRVDGIFIGPNDGTVVFAKTMRFGADNSIGTRQEPVRITDKYLSFGGDVFKIFN